MPVGCHTLITVTLAKTQPGGWPSHYQNTYRRVDEATAPFLKFVESVFMSIAAVDHE